MKRYCRNCYHPLPYKAKFCAHCGQKDTDGRIAMKSLMMRLWNNTFHLEGKFIRTAWQLFIPGKVTLEFFKGKQDRYPHPIRTFGIVMFLFLFVLNFILKQRESRNSVDPPIEVSSKNSADSLASKPSLSAYEQAKYTAILYDFRQDYEALPGSWKTLQTDKTVDSLLKKFAQQYDLHIDSPLDSILQNPQDSTGFATHFTEGYEGIQIATLDLVRYDPEEIIRRYHIHRWWERLLVKQGVKSYKTPDALVHSMVGSLTWAILALVAMMSMVLALLYLRQGRYYVEHFVFLLHFHTGAMLLLLIALLGKLAGFWGGGMLGATAFLPLPGMYFAMFRYYQQGWFKTLIKWWLYSFFYLITFVFLFILGISVVFALF